MENIIDCLPSVPPPYTTCGEVTSRLSHTRSRSQSVEHILESADMDSGSKACCDALTCRLCVTSCLRFRCVLIMLSTAGFCSTLAGVVLGIIRVPETSYLTLSLMFAGLGALLFMVMFIGWRCTPSDHEPCHLLFGLGSYSMVQRAHFSRRSRTRLNWIGGRLFPEFRYRRPPPSYTVSMQEYQHHVITLQDQGIIPQTPPPTYRHTTTRLSRQKRAATNTATAAVHNPPSYADVAPSLQAQTHHNGSSEQSTCSGVDNPSYSMGLRSENTTPVLSSASQSESQSQHVTSEINSHDEPVSTADSDDGNFYGCLGEVTHL